MKANLKVLLTPRTWVALLILSAILTGSWLLGAFDYIEPVKEFMDSDTMAFSLGDERISAFDIIRTILVVLVIFLAARIIAEYGRVRIRSMTKIKASNRAILAKAYQAAVYFVSFLLILHILGIDFIGLTVFSGAIGIGIGFGLQKITSNFISGLILLFEKSIEEGDLIELGEGLSGFVIETGARYTLVETFEGKEVMIPNEDFITNQVTNWTYNNSQGRVTIDIGVSYDSNINKAHDLILEAAEENPRSSKNPKPECFLVNFGESSVDFKLYFWVDDIISGRNRPKSDILFSIWKKFEAHGIKIPFPQRDIHMINQNHSNE